MKLYLYIHWLQIGERFVTESCRISYEHNRWLNSSTFIRSVGCFHRYAIDLMCTALVKSLLVLMSPNETAKSLSTSSNEFRGNYMYNIYKSLSMCKGTNGLLNFKMAAFQNASMCALCPFIKKLLLKFCN